MLKKKLKSHLIRCRLLLGIAVAVSVLVVVAGLVLPQSSVEARSYVPEVTMTTAQQTQQTPVLSVSVVNTSVVEGGYASFSISSSSAPAVPITINYQITQTGQYAVPDEVRHRSLTLNDASTTVGVRTVDDSLDENDGSISLILHVGNGYTVGTTSSAVVTIEDNDLPPTLKISRNAASFTEGATATFTLTATQSCSYSVVFRGTYPCSIPDMTVNYYVSQNGDYVTSSNLGSKQLTLTEYNTSIESETKHRVVSTATATATISVPTVNDRLHESDGAVLVMLLPDDDYQVGMPNTVSSVVVDDDDPPFLTLSAAASEITEGDTATFTLTSSHAVNGTVTVNYHVAQNGDYVASGDRGGKTLMLTGNQATITVPTTNDTLDEADGAALVLLLPGMGYEVGSSNTALTVVRDDDMPLPVVRISSSGAIQEGHAAQYVFSVDPVPSSSLTVHYTVSQNSGHFDQVEEESLGAKALTIDGSTTTISIPTVKDIKGEPMGSVSVVINDGVGYQTGTQGTASVIVHDDDSYPVLTATGGPFTITEGESFDATISSTNLQHPTSLKINYRVVDPGDRAEVSDGIQTAQLFFSPDISTKTVTIRTWSNVKDEPDSDLMFVLLDGPGYYVGTPNTVSARVLDDDAPVPMLTLTADSASVIEGDSVSYTITANEAPEGSLAVNYEVRNWGGGASRFVASSEFGSKTLTLTGTSAKITIPTINDNLAEPNGSIAVRLFNGSGYINRNNQWMGVDIWDNDVESDVSVFAGTKVTEGGSVSFTFKADPAPVGSLTVSYDISQDGNFISNDDTGRKTVNITGSSITVNIPTIDDNTHEPHGWVRISLNNGPGYSHNYTDYYDAVRVEDNDSARVLATDVPVLKVNAGADIIEGGSASFTISSNLILPDGGLEVTYHVRQTGDFVAASELGLKTMTMTTVTTTVTVPTINDSVAEEHGTVMVQVVDSHGYNINARGSDNVVAVRDNDSAAKPVITISGGPTVTEGEDVVFTITASNAPSFPIYIGLGISESHNGDTNLDWDNINTALTLTGTSAIMRFPTIDDDKVGHSSTVRLYIYKDEYYTVGTPREAEVIVLDDEPIVE